MNTVQDILEERFSRVLSAVTGVADCPAIVRPAKDPKFGDYQVNGVMGLAKQVKTNPRKLAERVVEQVDVSDICEPPEVAGPGFINLRLKTEYVVEQLLRTHADENDRLGIEPEAEPQTVVVDFSSPNVAKQMHVGHLRSTIIGDAVCRLLECLGHTVIRQNHIGDWGTQFGRVVLGFWHLCMAARRDGPPYYETELRELRTLEPGSDEAVALCRRIRDRHEHDWREDSKEELGDGKIWFKPFLDLIDRSPPPNLWREFLKVYQYVSALEEVTSGMGLEIATFREGEEITIPYESVSRYTTVMLQKSQDERQEYDPDAREMQEYRAWELVRDLTLSQCNTIYRQLGVTLTDEHVRGEQAYHPRLPAVVEDLRKTGLARESDGAVCVFPEGFKNKEGQALPFIIQKSDGAFLYATTDLAALRYRVSELKADKIVYVTDSRQALHFEMLFKVADMAGWDRRDGEKVELVHVMFGSVLDENGKPLKTRSGENVKLRDLLDEAVERARAVVEEKNPELSAEQKADIAQAVGIGAVKYADYSNNRTSDYVFSFEKMLAMDGNTAPYMQYAYARVMSIQKKAKDKGVNIDDELRGIAKLDLSEPSELDLGKHLVRYGEAVESAANDYRPNYLTAYLYELAQRFSAFYTNCPVLDAPPDKRPTRLLLCDLTARTIRHGLERLLGIAVVEQM